MGIKGLIGFLSETAPGSLTEVTLEQLSGTTVAIDASTALYQFTVAIREGSNFSALVNSKGEPTSHISGLMNRCLKLIEAGIKVIFVFDSTPPELKLQTLAKRREVREEAEKCLEKALDDADAEAVQKYMKRTVHISKKENQSAKELLRLMGIPIIDAAEEAEAQCAYLVQKGLADSVGTEDADALVFRCGTLLKRLTAGGKKIMKVNLEKVLELLNLTHDQFIDFCILCGCDYCGTIRGIGPKTAYSLIKKFDTIERILEVKSETLQGFELARAYFKNPKVNPVEKIVRSEVDVEGLKEFLIKQNDFEPNRVKQFIERLLKAKTTKTQVSLRSFFLKAPTVVKSHPVVKETPVIKETPVVNEVPIVNEAPIVKETPVIRLQPEIKTTSILKLQPVLPCAAESTKCLTDEQAEIPAVQALIEKNGESKRAYRPTIGLLAVCPPDVKFINKKRHVRC